MLKKLTKIDAHDIYYHSPIFMQHVFTSAYGYKLKRERYTGLYREALKRYIRGGIRQEDLLLELMHHLKGNIEVYKNIRIDEKDLLKSFKRLPMTVKEDLRSEVEERSYKKGIIRKSTTSGTTGANLVVYESEHDRARRMAFLDYIKYQNGVMPFSRRASFTEKELNPVNHKNKLWRYNITMKQMLYGARSMTPDNMKYVYASLAKFKPETLDGFTTSVHMVAKYMLRNGITADWEVKGIFPSSEMLLPHMKEDIEKAFNTKLIDTYASSEGAPFIYGTPEGWYQVGHETGLFEFFRKDHNIYEMVVTSYVNHATPVIRYRIGDQVEIESDAKYLNSYEDDIKIKKIIGRGADFLYTTDGNKITSVIATWVILGMEELVSHIQFVQKAMDDVIINLVVEDDYTKEDEAAIREKMKRMLGKDIGVTFKYMSAIPKERSGKTRMIINEVG